jgi:serine O-acetyltransferase
VTGARDLCRARGHHRLAELRRSIRADIGRYQHKSPENAAKGDTLRTRLGALLTPQLLCLVVHRFAHLLWARGWRRTACAIAGLNLTVFKVNISPGSCLGPGCFMPHPGGVTFHGIAGAQATFYTQSVCCPMGGVIGAPVEAGPRLGDRVTVGCCALVRGPIVVGDDVNVAPKAHVDRDAPAGTIAVSAGFRCSVSARA